MLASALVMSGGVGGHNHHHNHHHNYNDSDNYDDRANTSNNDGHSQPLTPLRNMYNGCPTWIDRAREDHLTRMGVGTCLALRGGRDPRHIADFVVTLVK